LKGGMVAETTTVEIEEPDGRLRKLVIKRPSSIEELRVMELLQALKLPAPAPRYFHAPEKALAMDFIDGTIDFGLADTDGYLGQMAEQLAALHAVDLSGQDVSFLRLREPVCWELNKLPEMPTGAGFDVRRAAARLRERPLAAANDVRLLHGDFWAGNMLWQDGRITAVIDWEDAGIGDPLKDLAEARVEIVWLFGVQAVETFTDHYRAKAAANLGAKAANLALDYHDLPYWDLCAVLRLWRIIEGRWGWLADFVADYGRDDLTDMIIRERYKQFVSHSLKALQTTS
jgi:aminoglycoside phosphotransferase (APT) family kinase protein